MKKIVELAPEKKKVTEQQLLEYASRNSVSIREAFEALTGELRTQATCWANARETWGNIISVTMANQQENGAYLARVKMEVQITQYNDNPTVEFKTGFINSKNDENYKIGQEFKAAIGKYVIAYRYTEESPENPTKKYTTLLGCKILGKAKQLNKGAVSQDTKPIPPKSHPQVQQSQRQKNIDVPSPF